MSRGRLERIADILAIRELTDLRALAEAYRDPIVVWAPGRDRSVRRAREAREALALHRKGWLFYAIGVDKFIPALRPHLAMLERELGLSPGAGRCSIFAAKRGSGAKPHFDFGYGFNLQLVGRKRWTIAENESVAEPTIGYSIGDEPSKELASYAGDRLPEKMPAPKRSFVLGPGDLMFTPRGSWHTTKCLDDSISIDFDFCPKNVADVVLGELRARLYERERWRRTAFDLAGWRGENAAALQSLDALIAELPEIVQSISADDAARRLEDLPEPIDRRWRFLPAKHGVLRERKASSFVFSVEGGEEVEIAPPLVPLTRWIASRREPFVGAEAVAQAPSLPPASVVAVIAAMIEIGVLRRVPSPGRTTRRKAEASGTRARHRAAAR